MSLGPRGYPDRKVVKVPKQTVTSYKTYDVSRDRALQGGSQIHYNNELLYTARASSSVFGKGSLELYKGDSSGVLLATIEGDKGSTFSIKTEDPSLSNLREMKITKSGDVFDDFYQFEAGGRSYAWQQTRQYEVTVAGDSERKCDGLDWKLVYDPEIPDEGQDPQEILAVYLHEDSWKPASSKAKIHWIGSSPAAELEMISLAVIMGAVKQSKNAARTTPLFGGVGAGIPAIGGAGGGGA